MRTPAFVVALCLSLACSSAQQRSYDSLRTLNADLLAASSATRVLQAHCGQPIRAVRLTDVRKEASAEQLQRLAVRQPSDLRYRRVELRCGARVFSVADNWYVPARLTAEMNAQLDTSDSPFGKVIAPLHPYRRTIDAEFLWSPPSPMPHDVLQHRAVVYTGDGAPLAEVVETYQSDSLQ